MELALWVPLLIIFASALLAAIVKRYTRDICLKAFHKSFVLLKLKDGRWISGDLLVYSNCLELNYRSFQPLGEHYQKLSYVLYEHNLDSIDRILRPSPKTGTKARREWDREISRLQYPSAMRRARRKIRNIFNMLRDAFAQAVTLIFGAVKRRTRLGAIPVDESRIGEMGRSLISVVPNAYEPVLEKYLGHHVVIETLLAENKPVEQSGILQEYSSKYLLTRDVDLLPETPAEVLRQGPFEEQFDVIFPRPANVVRHLAAERKPENMPHEGTAGESLPAAHSPDNFTRSNKRE
jgi:hypothetical protein